MADNIPAWAGDPGKVDGPAEVSLLRVDGEDIAELGEHTVSQAEKLARQLSQENPGIEYLVDFGDRAERYQDGECRGQMLSSTRRRA